MHTYIVLYLQYSLRVIIFNFVVFQQNPKIPISPISMCMMSTYSKDVYQWKSDNPITDNVFTIHVIVCLICLSDWQTYWLWSIHLLLQACLEFLISLLCLVSNNKLMKGKALRKHSLHEKTAASVLLKLFISRNEWCHTTDAP